MLTRHDTIILLILVGICLLLIGLMNYVLKQKNKKQIQVAFEIIFGLMLLWIVAMVFQIILMNRFNISIKYFNDIYYVSLCYLPIAFLFMTSVFEKGNVKLKKKDLLLFIIPTITVILVWTNDFHHLVYTEYTTSLSTTYGWYFYVHTFYTYFLFAI